MSPQVEAALIAAGVGVLTVITTAFTQYLGRRATSKQLDRTLTEQRTRTLNERFATAAGQLGDDKPPAVRLAGVYAMAGLADDWHENRQTCVDVLCAYLRLPYEPDPGDDAPSRNPLKGPIGRRRGGVQRSSLTDKQLGFHGSREVRHTVIRAITAHLRDDAAVSWRGLNFDFTGAVFDGGAFTGAVFSGGRVDFGDTEFSGGTVDFSGARFSGSTVVSFRSAEFSGGRVDFSGAVFSGGTVSFGRAEFSRAAVHFEGAKFSGGWVPFVSAVFSGGEVSFGGAKFSGGQVDFRDAEFSGSTVDFRNVEFSGSTVDFSGARDWSVPPIFPWTGTPPPGVKLPGKVRPRGRPGTRQSREMRL
jgi:hypothetical protein